MRWAGSQIVSPGWTDPYQAGSCHPSHPFVNHVPESLTAVFKQLTNRGIPVVPILRLKSSAAEYFPQGACTAKGPSVPRAIFPLVPTQTVTKSHTTCLPPRFVDYAVQAETMTTSVSEITSCFLWRHRLKSNRASCVLRRGVETTASFLFQWLTPQIIMLAEHGPLQDAETRKPSE